MPWELFHEYLRFLFEIIFSLFLIFLFFIEVSIKYLPESVSNLDWLTLAQCFLFPIMCKTSEYNQNLGGVVGYHASLTH